MPDEIKVDDTKSERHKCGIVMPIAGFADYTETHWRDVLEIITQAASRAGFEANLVSNADEIGIIQKRIVQNLYDNPIVICDVSGKNPNVMFELGLRLAFDKPTIIIKDSVTNYSFDTAPIEHLTYPKDLRYGSIVEFTSKLAQKIEHTVKPAQADQQFSPFLKTFGEFTVPKLNPKEVSTDEYILEELRSLRTSIRRIEAGTVSRSPRLTPPPPRRIPLRDRELDICLAEKTNEEISSLRKELENLPFPILTEVVHHDDHEHVRLLIEPDNDETRKQLNSFLRSKNLHYRPGLRSKLETSEVS